MKQSSHLRRIAASIVFGFVASSATSRPVVAAETVPLVIGVAAPLTGPTASLGAEVMAGARAAAAGRSKDGVPVRIVEGDTQCSAEGGKQTAARFVAEKAAMVTGFLCAEALEAALPVLSAAGIATIDIGVRAGKAAEKRAGTKVAAWRIAPHSGDEAEAVAALVTERWKNEAFGIVDDGTIYGRGLSDAVRSLLEAESLRAATIDTYRPAEEKQFGIARRILASGVTHLVMAGDRPDVAVIARDAASIGLDLSIIGGEALFDEPSAEASLPVGTLAVGLSEQMARPAAGVPGEEAARQGYFAPSFAAVEIAVEAVHAASAGSRPVADIMSTTRFTTVLGPVAFDAKGASDLKPFRAFRYDGRDFAPEAGGERDNGGG